MIAQLYVISFIISLLLLMISLILFRDRISLFYYLMFISIIIENFGNMQLVSSDNLKMAIYANQTIYLGSCFIPFFSVMCISNLCKSRVNKIFQIFLLSLSVIVLFFISTIGLVPGYYNDIHFYKENGIAYLIKDYGPAHNIYIIYLFLIAIYGLYVIINSFRKKKDISFITSILLLSVFISVIAVYISEKIIHLRVDLLPLAYIIGEIIIIILLRRISLYDVAKIFKESMVSSSDYGFVVLDVNGRFLGGDEIAKKWFPELTDLPIDKCITRRDTPLLNYINEWIEASNDEEIRHKKISSDEHSSKKSEKIHIDNIFKQTVQITSGNQIIEAKHSILRENKRRFVHCIYLRDDTKQQRYMKLVEEYNENLEKDVNKKTAKIRQIQEDIIISMASIVENRDNNTGGHIKRTSDVVKIFVSYLLKKGCYEELNERIAKRITKSAPLHDFGKIAIPDVILNKPGKFTDEEYEKMKEHSAKGAVIVERILQNSEDNEFKQIAVNVAHFHHEKWDGTGYPEKLKGEEIPFEARIMALADVFDALVSKRVYKDSFSYEKAFSIIEESSGSHFDPDLCKDFLECKKKFVELYDSYEN